MKLSDLRLELEKRGIDPTTVEPLHNGKKVSSKDYIRTIQEYEIEQLGGFSSLSWGMQQRLNLGEPMLCANYKDMKQHEQEECMTSDYWIAERKLDGVRMITTYHPNEGFGFFSRNLSVKNFLPGDYTNIILINHQGVLKEAKDTIGIYIMPFVLDTEATSKTSVIDTTKYKKNGGTVTNSRLNAINTILSDKTNSHTIQREQCEVTIITFDCLNYQNEPITTSALRCRLLKRADLMDSLVNEGFIVEEANYSCISKQEFYDTLIAAGEEGVVLKNLNSPYCSTGSRAKDGFVKRKRTVSEAYGSDIDAYIVGSSASNKKNKFAHLIGAVDLAVMLQMKDGSEEEKIIASVGAMPLAMREEMTVIAMGEPTLNPRFHRKVLTIDGQDISPKSKSFRHARADWDRGFRTDKTSMDCKLDEEFIDSQIF